jgi:HPt (histidine-containing phosphotransfer) domain-containing protein
MHRVDGDEALLRDLLPLFSQDVRVRLQQLNTAVTASDATGLARAAHSIKGMVATFAAHQAFALAKQLEELGRGGRLTDAAQIAGQLTLEVVNLEQQLSVML